MAHFIYEKQSSLHLRPKWQHGYRARTQTATLRSKKKRCSCSTTFDTATNKRHIFSSTSKHSRLQSTGLISHIPSCLVYIKHGWLLQVKPYISMMKCVIAMNVLLWLKKMNRSPWGKKKMLLFLDFSCDSSVSGTDNSDPLFLFFFVLWNSSHYSSSAGLWPWMNSNNTLL